MYANGILLHVTEDRVKNPKATVIITHGIAEHSGRYHHITKRLNQAKYDVIRYDLRGHGQSAGARGKLKHHLEMVHDLHALVLEIKKQDSSIYLLGHSLGGLIVHMYAVTYQDVKGIITSGASTDYLKDVLPFRIFGVRLLSFYRVKTNFADNKLSRIQTVETNYLNDPLNLKKMYGSLIGNMLFKGVQYLKRNIKKHNVKTLILHGKDDKIVPYTFAQQMYEEISHEDKTLCLYEDSYHEIFHDLDQEHVFKDVMDWLDDHTKKDPTST
jgi:acylglycerol lipase